MVTKRGSARLPRFVGLGVAASLALGSTAAIAQSAPAAEALFAEGRELMAKGELAAACAKLADSEKLDPAPGTAFNLALCYERSGRTASAWAEYKTAASGYAREGRGEWEARARARVAALEPTLPRLRISLVAPVPAGVVVTRDGRPVLPSELDASLPTDPGRHHVEVTAPGRRAFSRDVDLTTSKLETVNVPPLEADDAKEARPANVAAAWVAPSDDAARPSTSLTPLTIAALSVGGVGLVTGSVTGLMALSKNRESERDCPNDGACASQSGVDANHAARDLGTVSTIGFVAGAALVVGGVVLLVAAPRAGARATAHVRNFGLGGAW